MSTEVVFSTHPNQIHRVDPGKATVFQGPSGEEVIVHCRPSDLSTTVISTEVLGYGPRNWVDRMLRKQLPIYGESRTSYVQ